MCPPLQGHDKISFSIEKDVMSSCRSFQDATGTRAETEGDSGGPSPPTFRVGDKTTYIPPTIPEVRRDVVVTVG